MSRFIKWCNDNQGIIAIISIIAAIVLASYGSLLAGIVLIVLIIIFFYISRKTNLFGSDSYLTRLKEINTSQNKDTNAIVLNNVPFLIANLPNNNDFKHLYEEIYNHAKKWSSDAKLVGSRIYIDFEHNHCTYHIIGIIDSQIRHERKKFWVPDIYEIIEEQNFGEVTASKKLTDYQNWRLAVIKVLESTASDIEKLEKCFVQILPTSDLSISIFFEKLPRKWSKHFELKEGVLYQGKNIIYKIN